MLGTHAHEGYCSLFVCVCVCVCLSVCYCSSANVRCVCAKLNLPAKVFKMQISLKLFLCRVIACFSLSHSQGGHLQSLKLPRGNFN